MSDHWLEVGPEALERMRVLPAMALLRRSEGQSYETVSVPLTALYNMYEVDVSTADCGHGSSFVCSLTYCTLYCLLN